MDLELSPTEHPWTAVFKPIHLLPNSALTPHSIQLENSFQMSPEQPQVLLTLAGTIIFLSEGRGSHVEPLAGAELSFDLKF